GKQLFYALLNGAAQYPILLQSDELFHLGKWLMDEGITIFISLPTAFRHLATMLPEGKKCPNLRVIRLGGESLSKKDVELYKRHFSSGCVLVNMYASQETGTVSQYLMKKSTTVNGRRVPVGYPRSGIKIYLLDDLGKEVSRDQTGEIVVQSRELNSGSWQGRDKTAKPAPLKSLEAGESLYFTGDFGRVFAGGFLGRVGSKGCI